MVFVKYKFNKKLLFPIFFKYGKWLNNPCNGGGWKIWIFYYNAYDKIEILFWRRITQWTKWFINVVSLKKVNIKKFHIKILSDEDYIKLKNSKIICYNILDIDKMNK